MTPTVTPDRSTFLGNVETGAPVVTYLSATLEVETTPLAAYATLAGHEAVDESTYAFLLESAEKVASSDPDGAFAPERVGRHARFSFVGYDPDAVITVGPDRETIDRLKDSTATQLVTAATDGGDVLDALRASLPAVDRVGFPDTDRQQLDGGLVGFLAYDAVYDLWLDEVGLDRPASRFPDAQFVLTTKTVAIDHANGTVDLVMTPVIGPDDDPETIYEEVVAEAEHVEQQLSAATVPTPGGFVQRRETAGAQDAYEAAVRRAKEHVLDGDIYQGVISRTRELEGKIDPLGLYAALRDVNPSPYMYLLGYGDLQIVGASPETLVSVRGREVISNPIAGTCPRGNSPVEDRRLAGEMLADDKERAEHTMLVDLARNDLRRVCDAGSVQVEEFMNVLKYSHVQHIESTVTGQLVPEYDAFDATRATFPAGTLAGAPKIRAMEIIDELEVTPRGPYGGGVGYYSWNGDADFAIVIRTATIEQGDPDRITVQAGAGIVADSVPAREFEETEKKMDGVLAALDQITAREPEAQR